MVVASREFWTNYLSNEEADGSIVEVASTENCEYSFPADKSVVLASTNLYGNIFTPDPEDPNKCTYFTFSEIDMKGIPDWIMKQAFKDIATSFNQVKKFLPKWKEEYGIE